MALKTLNQIRQTMKEPQLLHKWKIEVPTWPTIGSPANPDVLILVTTSDLPASEQIDTSKIALGAHTMNFNGKSSRNGEISWTFFENTSKDVIEYFFKTYANQRFGFDSVNNISAKSAPTADLIVPVINMNLYDPSGSVITQKWQLINCMFKPTGAGGSLGQDATPQQPTVAVEYDSYVIV